MGILLGGVLIILTLILWVWAIVDIVKSIFRDTIQKIIWLMAVILFPIFGSILYFQLGRKYTTRKPRRFQPGFN